MPPGSNVTMRIRSWRPAIPSISGPRSRAANSFTSTPFVAGPVLSFVILVFFPTAFVFSEPQSLGPARTRGFSEQGIEIKRTSEHFDFAFAGARPGFGRL